MTQTAPFIIQWAEGGPRGSQGVTLMISLTGAPNASQLMFRAELVTPFVVSDARRASCGEPSTDSSLAFVFKVDGVQVATVTFASGSSVGVFAFDSLVWPIGVLTMTAPSLITDPIADVSVTITGAQ